MVPNPLLSDPARAPVRRRVADAVEARLAGLFGGPDMSAHDRGSARGPGSAHDRGRAEPDVAGAAPSGASGEPGPRTTNPSGHRAGRRRTVWRLDPGRRTAMAMVLVVIGTAGLVGGRMIMTRPRAEALPATSVSVTMPGDPATPATATPSSVTATSPSSGPTTGPTAGAASASPASATVVVDVVGRVRRPGLVRLPVGSRVDDAIRAAGGARAGTNLSGINLARVCVDGEQIAVGVPGAGAPAAGPAAPGATGATGSMGPAAPVNLNTATSEQLDTLPGVGPVMAQRIIDWRTSHGPFGSVDELQQVSGVGDVTFARLRSLVTV